MDRDAHRPVRAKARWPAVAAGVIIALAALVAYRDCFRAPFIFDDEWAVTKNPTIRHLSRIGTVLAADTGNGAGVRGRPMINLSLAINYALGGTDVRGYHATNLAIHILAALVLLGILRRTLAGIDGDPERRVGAGGRRPPSSDVFAFIIALLWAVHPLQTETVVCVVQRTESIMGLFYLLTLYCFIRAVGGMGDHRTTDRKTPPEDGRVGRDPPIAPNSLAGQPGGGVRRPRPAVSDPLVRGPGSGGLESDRPRLWFALCFLACLFGMASKEVMASAPLVVLLYDRTFVAGTFRAAWARRKRLYLALASTWLLLAGLIATENGRGGTVGFGLGVSPWDYALTQCRALVMYLKLCLWPHPLVVDYGTYLDHSLIRVLPQAVIVVGFLGLTVWALVRKPRSGFLGACFFLILAPSSSVIPLASQTIAEHRMYLPLAVVLTLGVMGARRLLGRRSVPLFLVLALAFGWLTTRRTGDYRTAVGIWRTTVAEVPDNPRAHYNLGVLLQRRHQTDAAAAQFHDALRLKPDYADAHNNLGSILFQQGHVRAAVAECERAVEIEPKLAVAHYNLGRALYQLGRGAEAIAQYEAAIRLKPEYVDAIENLGAALLKGGRTKEAIAHLQEALRLAPKEADLHYNLAEAYDQEGNLPKAIKEYEAAIQLKPDYADAHNNLAYALARQGRVSEAVRQVEEAIRLRPGDANSRINLANLLVSTGQWAEAIEAYRAALRLAPGDAEARFNLAQALLEENRVTDAVDQLRIVLKLKPDFAPARTLLDRIRAGGP